MLRKIKTSAPGKLILSGEHAVVYGKPEIITAINRRLTVTVKDTRKKSRSLIFSSQEPADLLEVAVKEVLKILNKHPKRGLEISIDSEIPVGSGLGSSAALAVATTAALFEYFGKSFDKEKINEIAYGIEKKQHGNPSGGDNTISAYGGFLWYLKETESLKLFKPLSFNANKLPKFVLINTGRPVETTGEMVAGARKLYDKERSKTEEVLSQIEEVTKQMLVGLNQANHKLVKLAIRENEKLLEKLGVVSDFTKKIIREIEKLGGVAKICGAGGKKKGSGIILAFHPQKEVLFKSAQKKNLLVFEAKLGEEGVRVEKS